jgi:hypothetical protein
LRLLPFLFLLLACTAPSGPRKTGFYYWQTELAITPVFDAYLQNIACKTLYVKFLDIGRNPDSHAIEPLSLLECRDTQLLSDKTIIPCIFLTNNVFQDITPAQIDWLALKTLEALESVGAQFPGRFNFKTPGTSTEIQFDCDWTGETKTAYFAYLQAIKEHLPAHFRLSATIRLHQYKFPKQTGVPPVERGMLMFYNTGDLDDPNTQNSIFDLPSAQKYIQGAPQHYPLPLDIALPVFSWALAYRDGHLWKIIANPEDSLFSDTSKFTVCTNPLNFVVQKATFLRGHYLRPGDQIRIERMTPALLQEAAQLAASIQVADDAVLAFFQADSSVVRAFPPSTLQTIWHDFQAKNR